MTRYGGDLYNNPICNNSSLYNNDDDRCFANTY